MKFSIVTISYNQAQFLEQAIRSVIEQDYPDVEYIVVDPGSTDGSREIIERYRDRIDRIIFEPDKGPADGLNKGFAQATGDVFGFSKDISCCLSKSLIQPISRSLIRLENDLVDPVPVAFDDFPAPVGRAGVNNDVLNVRVVLLYDRSDCLLKKLRLVVGNRNDGELHR